MISTRGSVRIALMMGAIALLAGQERLTAAPRVSSDREALQAVQRAKAKELLVSPARRNAYLAEQAATCAGNAQNLLFPYPGTGSWIQSMPRNDDGYTGLINLGFTFSLFGVNYTSCYINNNGNVSFGSPFYQYTSTGFPVSGYPMIAAFWADVDTRNSASGLVWHKIIDSNGNGTPDTLIVTWDNVGYYGSHADLLNTFQLAISDGTNPIIGLGHNVAFSYDHMCWTTGDASGGSGGFGGVPATVGGNRGDGSGFFMLGRYSSPAPCAADPATPPAVHCLDGYTLAFRPQEVPPTCPPSETIVMDLATNPVLDRVLTFTAAEPDQTLTVAIADPNNAQAAGLAITNTPGNEAQVALNWTPACRAAGNYTLTFTASDNNVPPNACLTTLTIQVVDTIGCDRPPTADAGGPYSVACTTPGPVTIQLNGSGSDPDGDPLTYAWTSDCVGATFSDPNIASPTLTLPAANEPRVCHVSLTVSDGARSASDDADIVVGPTLTLQVVDSQGQPTGQTLFGTTDSILVALKVSGLCNQKLTGGQFFLEFDSPDICWMVESVTPGAPGSPPADPSPFQYEIYENTSLAGTIDYSVGIQLIGGSPSAADNIMATIQMRQVEPQKLAMCCNVKMKFRTAENSTQVVTELGNVILPNLIDTPQLTIDVVAPDITVPPPAEITLAADENCEARVPDICPMMQFSDNCDPVPTCIQDPPAGATIPEGDTIVTVTVVDDAGNATGVQVTVHVCDQTPPTIDVCPPARTLAADANCKQLMPDLCSELVAHDNCGPNPPICTQSPVAGTEIGLGVTIVTLTVTDDGTSSISSCPPNSSTCTVAITVCDQTPPTIDVCPPARTLAADANCKQLVPDLCPELVAHDNCGPNPPICTQSPAAGTEIGLGVTIVTLTVTDDGTPSVSFCPPNSSTCTVAITVEDQAAPVVELCPPARTLAADANCKHLVPDLCAEAVARDNCDPAPRCIQDPPAGTEIGVGITVVTLTFTDVAGNVSEPCMVAITVEDQTAPVVEFCPPARTLAADANCKQRVPDLCAEAVARDNCDPAPRCIQIPEAGAEIGAGITVVTLTFTDARGNVSEPCMVEITVCDQTPPVIVYLPPPRTLAADADCKQLVPDLCAEVVVRDNCDPAPTCIQDPPAGTQIGLGVTVVTVTIADHGTPSVSSCPPNSTTFTVAITVEDQAAPAVTCPENRSVPADPGLEGAYVTYPAGSAQDNCGASPPVTCTPPSGSFFPIGVTTVTCSATDEAGNVGECTFTVTVKPTNAVNLTVRLAGQMKPEAFTRGIRLEVVDKRIPGALVQESCVTMTFINGVATNQVVEVPNSPLASTYTCISARDPLHTVKKVTGLELGAPDPDGHVHEYRATFDGTDALMGGNLSGDNNVDIVDYAYFRPHMWQNLGTPNTTCDTLPPSPPLPAAHADFDGDGKVTMSDLSFIVSPLNFLKRGETLTADCPAPTSVQDLLVAPLAAAVADAQTVAPRTRVSVAELAALGVPDAAGSDMNGDGYVDMTDLKLFVKKGGK